MMLWRFQSKRKFRCPRRSRGDFCFSVMRPLWGNPANSPNRPQPAGQSYVSISAGGAPGNRVEWPVFGGQVDDPTAATRPFPDGHAQHGECPVLGHSGLDDHFLHVSVMRQEADMTYGNQHFRRRPDAEEVNVKVHIIRNHQRGSC